MNQLVFVENQQIVTDSLTVAEVFGKRHSDVIRDIEVQINKLIEASEHEFTERNFAECDYINDSATGINKNRKYKKFNLSEEAFTLVAMSYTTPEAMKMKVKFIQEFKKMREKLLTSHAEHLIKQFNLPRNYPEALRELAEFAGKVEQLEAQIENDREKVLLANAITTSDEGMLIEAAAKYMRQNGVKIGRDRLFKWLRSKGYLISRKGREWNMPSQKALNRGLMKIHCQLDYDSEGELRANRQVVVTGKGLMFFINKFLHEGQLKLDI